MQLSFAKSAPLWRDIAVTLAVLGDERLQKSDRSSRWTLELKVEYCSSGAECHFSICGT